MCRAYNRNAARRRRGSVLAGVEGSVPPPVYQRAMSRLVELHRDELAALIADELAGVMPAAN